MVGSDGLRPDLIFGCVPFPSQRSSIKEVPALAKHAVSWTSGSCFLGGWTLAGLNASTAGDSKRCGGCLDSPVMWGRKGDSCAGARAEKRGSCHPQISVVGDVFHSLEQDAFCFEARVIRGRKEATVELQNAGEVKSETRR